MSRVNLVTYCQLCRPVSGVPAGQASSPHKALNRGLEVVELADQTDTTGAGNFPGRRCPSMATPLV
jgi:hypothetical protein